MGMVIGHERILEFLEGSIKNKRLAHAYLFTGPACLGKRTVALEFIRMLVGNEIDKAVHPDISIIEPKTVEKEEIRKESGITIKQAREIQHQMSMFPYQADYKIALIDQAEKMSIEAANCLLKTLEEPTGKAILILVTASPKKLLPTIISRCQLVNFLPVRAEEIEKKIIQKFRSRTSKLKQIVRLANGRPGLAINYLKNPELLDEQNKIISQLEKLLRSDLNERYQYVEQMAKDAPMARQILNYWLFWFRDLFLLTVGCSDLVIHPEAIQYQKSYSFSLAKLKKIIETIKKTDWLLTNPSINARLALEVLMLEL